MGTKRRLGGCNIRVCLESVQSSANGPTQMGTAERLAVRPAVGVTIHGQLLGLGRLQF